MKRGTVFARGGFTLVELMIVVAVIALILTLAAPSFRSMILMQRLKGTNAQFVTDLQFARAEAAARNRNTFVSFSNNAALTCYVVFTSDTGDPRECDCLITPTCPNPLTGTEIRTVKASRDQGVLIGPNPIAFAIEYSAVTGGINIYTVDARGAPPPAFVMDVYIDTPRKLRTVVTLAGRPSVCAPTNSTMSEPAC